MTKWPLLLALALLAVPLAQAHASPTPIDVDEHLLDDDTSDDYALYDGFDLQDLFVRESFVDGQEGLTFRMIIYGGPAPASAASTFDIALDIDAAGTTHTYSWASSDGLTWTGDGTVLESSLEMSPVEYGQAFDVVSGSLQVFVPLSELGVSLGDTVGPFAWRTSVDGDLRDVAPGGRPVPGTNGGQVLDGPSTIKAETLTLDGPIGYTKTSVSRDGDAITLKVENLITVIGQHIVLEIPDPAGWTIDRTNTNVEPVEPGTHPEFGFTATPTEGAEAFTFDVLSDLGGRETLTIAPPGGDSMPEHDHGDHDHGDGDAPAGEDSPSPLWLVGAALAAAVIARRQG